AVRDARADLEHDEEEREREREHDRGLLHDPRAPGSRAPDAAFLEETARGHARGGGYRRRRAPSRTARTTARLALGYGTERSRMANPKRKVSDNVAGEFFVDTTCIDCDTCRELAPEVFADNGEHSFVRAQPGRGPERRAALRALVACPTGSIGID